MATVYGTFIFGGVREPAGFNYLTTYTTSGTFTAPRKGWYRLHVVGKGGYGGQGGSAKKEKSKGGDAIASGGTSGSTAAYAIYEVQLRGGETISITIDSIAAKAVIAGVTVQAINGVDGYNGYPASKTNTSAGDNKASQVPAPSAAHVLASGGNIANVAGIQGNPSRWYESAYIGSFNGGGYGPYIDDPRCIYTPKEIIKSDAPSDEYNLGGAGKGGEGAWMTERGQDTGNLGRKGGQAGVVIEQGYN